MPDTLMGIARMMERSMTSRTVLVPTLPTRAMLAHGCDTAHGWPTYFDIERQWEAILAAVRKADVGRETVPNGFARVPVEPTDAMLYAGKENAFGNDGDGVSFAVVRAQWAAMIGEFVAACV